MKTLQFEKLEKLFKRAIYDLMSLSIPPFRKALNDRDMRIEELEVDNDDKDTSIKVLKEEIEDLESRIWELKKGKAYECD